MKTEELTLQKFGKGFPKGTILFQDGDLSKEMYVIHSGKVKIKKRIEDEEKVLAVLGQGDFFGEMATLLDKHRSATAEVMEDSILIVISPQTVETMIATNAGIALNIIKKLANRIWDANEKIENLMLKDGMGRIVHTLKHKTEASGIKEGESVVVKITPSELAHETGLEFHIVKDIMEKLAEINMVVLEEKSVKVKDIRKLKFFDLLALKKESGKV